MPLSAEDIQKGFAALSAELERRGERGQIAIAGGAAMVLLFNARQTTKDVDAFVVQPDPAHLREAVVWVARELELPADWLNDGAKGYFVGISEGEVVFASDFLLGREWSNTCHAPRLTRHRTPSMIFGILYMELHRLVEAILAGDLLTARQWVSDARRERLTWRGVGRPRELSGRELTVA